MKTMIRYIIVITLVVSAFSLSAQEGYFYQFKKKSDTKVKGSKIYYKNLENKGENQSINVNEIIKSNLDFYFKTWSGNAKKKVQNHISWTTNPLFEKADKEEEADVIISGNYEITTDVSIKEKLFYERKQSVGGAIPYYEIRQTNMASVEIVISYTYRDKSVVYDTISIVNKYERKPNTKYQSIEQLLTKCDKTLNLKVYNTFAFYTTEKIYYKFLKVKTSYKELKVELKEVNTMLSNGEIEKLGKLYQRIYESDKSNKDAAFNVAICYELIGNYPKAEEYYAINPDFHAKARMRTNRILFDYLKEIGANVKLKDF